MQRPQELSQIKLPKSSSHKGQNGRLLIIGGSKLFHAASLWSLKVASRIVDLVHYASVPENNRLVQDLKEEFRDGIVVPRTDIESYIKEDDAILIGPGMVRTEISNIKYQIANILDIEKMEDEGLQTAALTNYLLQKHAHKQWVIDAGSLQTMNVDLIPKNAILTPHTREFEYLLLRVKGEGERDKYQGLTLREQVQLFAREFQCILLVKGEVDIISDGERLQELTGGNPGMTKGGTGDVLAGLVAALACKNDPWAATVSASFINKQAGDDLYKTVGVYFNASDLADAIPKVMKQLLLK
ncbi:NAD(P)H-hydrate dehydratase [Candidatus Microgenomates bacterium]|nr:MAG: NAD(P)H-hydrate dehydratase [Candidatus Microgenomates bacterium]